MKLCKKYVKINNNTIINNSKKQTCFNSIILRIMAFILYIIHIYRWVGSSSFILKWNELWAFNKLIKVCVKLINNFTDWPSHKEFNSIFKHKKTWVFLNENHVSLCQDTSVRTTIYTCVFVFSYIQTFMSNGLDGVLFNLWPSTCIHLYILSTRYVGWKKWTNHSVFIKLSLKLRGFAKYANELLKNVFQVFFFGNIRPVVSFSCWVPVCVHMFVLLIFSSVFLGFFESKCSCGVTSPTFVNCEYFNPNKN